MKKGILSRKGYDDKYGQRPSIILPSGEMLSFPIPVKEGGSEMGCPSSKLVVRGRSLESVFRQLGHAQCSLNHHVDPAIVDHFGARDLGIFGQSGSAASHLRKQNVGPGDVFLFFGTFAFALEKEGTWSYSMCHPFHAIWGYLVVDTVLSTKEEIENSASILRNHPHYQNREMYGDFNTIYVGNNFGRFDFSEILRLTRIGFKKSYWSLPRCFRETPLTYHQTEMRELAGDRIEFESAAIGQEFVFERQPAIDQWISEVLRCKSNGA